MGDHVESLAEVKVDNIMPEMPELRTT